MTRYGSQQSKAISNIFVHAQLGPPQTRDLVIDDYWLSITKSNRQLLVLSHRQEKLIVDNKTVALVIDNKSIFPFEKEKLFVVDN